MDENLAYWSASFQRAGKWFSSSLALGTNVVANKTDRLFSDIPCYLDRAIVSAFLLLTHMVGPWPTVPQDRNLTLLYTLVSKVISHTWLHMKIPSCLPRWSIPDALNPFLTLYSGINRLSIRLKLPIVPSYFALDVLLSFKSRVTFRHLPRC